MTKVIIVTTGPRGPAGPPGSGGGTGGVTPGNKQDIQVFAEDNWQINAGVVGSGELATGAVTLPKMADLTKDRLIGRFSGAAGSSGPPEALTAAQVLTILSETGQLATGIGPVVRCIKPTVDFTNLGLRVFDPNESNTLALKPGSDLTAERTLTINTGDADRVLDLTGNATITGSNTGDQLTFKTIAGVVADATTDTLNILGAGNVTVAVTAADTITITGTGSGGSGDVVGPGTAVDNAAARFDSTTGKVIQSSAVTIDDSGNLTAGTYNKVAISTPGAGAALTVTGDVSSLQGSNTGDQLAFKTIGGVVADTTTDTLNITGGGNVIVSAAGDTITITGTGGGGTGDVAGPAGAIDDRVARFQGTTGKLIQDSAVTIDDTGNLSTDGKINNVTITSPGTGGALTVAEGATLSVSGSATVSGSHTGSSSNTNTGDQLAFKTVGGVVATSIDDTVNIAGAGGITVSALGNTVTIDGSSTGTGTGVTAGVKGDINVVGPDSNWQLVADAVTTNEILNKSVTLAKVQDITTPGILGRVSTPDGPPEQLTPAVALTMLGATAGTVTNTTGTGAIVRADKASVKLANAGLKVYGTGVAETNTLAIAPSEDLTADLTLSIGVNNANRSIAMSGNLTVSANATVSGTNTGDQNISGFVTGPTTSTDNRAARFDLATGKVIQESAVTIDDAGTLSTAGSYTTTGTGKFNNVTITTPSPTAGVLTIASGVTLNATANATVSGTNTGDQNVSGFVAGPATGGSTNNAAARFDQTTGRLVKNSALIIDDTGKVNNVTITTPSPSSATLTIGSGATLTVTTTSIASGTAVCVGTNSGNQNLFDKITAGATTVNATAPAQTLTIVGTGGITVTGDDTVAKTLTISASGITAAAEVGEWVLGTPIYIHPELFFPKQHLTTAEYNAFVAQAEAAGAQSYYFLAADPNLDGLPVSGSNGGWKYAYQQLCKTNPTAASGVVIGSMEVPGLTVIQYEPSKDALIDQQSRSNGWSQYGNSQMEMARCIALGLPGLSSGPTAGIDGGPGVMDIGLRVAVGSALLTELLLQALQNQFELSQELRDLAADPLVWTTNTNATINDWKLVYENFYNESYKYVCETGYVPPTGPAAGTLVKASRSSQYMGFGLNMVHNDTYVPTSQMHNVGIGSTSGDYLGVPPISGKTYCNSDGLYASVGGGSFRSMEKTLKEQARPNSGESLPATNCLQSMALAHKQGEGTGRQPWIPQFYWMWPLDRPEFVDAWTRPYCDPSLTAGGATVTGTVGPPGPVTPGPPLNVAGPTRRFIANSQARTGAASIGGNGTPDNTCDPWATVQTPGRYYDTGSVGLESNWLYWAKSYARRWMSRASYELVQTTNSSNAFNTGKHFVEAFIMLDAVPAEFERGSIPIIHHVTNIWDIDPAKRAEVYASMWDDELDMSGQYGAGTGKAPHVNPSGLVVFSAADYYWLSYAIYDRTTAAVGDSAAMTSRRQFQALTCRMGWEKMMGMRLMMGAPEKALMQWHQKAKDTAAYEAYLLANTLSENAITNPGDNYWKTGGNKIWWTPGGGDQTGTGFNPVALNAQALNPWQFDTSANIGQPQVVKAIALWGSSWVLRCLQSLRAQLTAKGY